VFATDGICRKYFAVQEVARLLQAHNMEDRSEQLYSLIVLDYWYRQFVKQPAEGRRPVVIA
jgi:hypothetical protein